MRLIEKNVNLIFESDSLAYAISVPVHNDTGKKDTRLVPHVQFSGALVGSGREFIGDNRERVYHQKNTSNNVH